MSTIDEIMVVASMIGDDRIMLIRSRGSLGDLQEAESAMREMITTALAEARREGAEAMRESAAQSVAGVVIPGWIEDASFRIRARPLPTGRRQAARLTDEVVIAEVCRTVQRGRVTPHGMKVFARAIESAVLKANGLGEPK